MFLTDFAGRLFEVLLSVTGDVRHEKGALFQGPQKGRGDLQMKIDLITKSYLPTTECLPLPSSGERCAGRSTPLSVSARAGLTPSAPRPRTPPRRSAPCRRAGRSASAAGTAVAWPRFGGRRRPPRGRRRTGPFCNLRVYPILEDYQV